MKYTITTEINIPRDKALELFQDIKFMKKWQHTFQSLEVIQGEAGSEASINKLTYDNKGKPSIIMETILKKDLPNDFNFLYEATGVKNWANNHFLDHGSSTTWIASHEFKFSGLMIFLTLFKKNFIKQTRSDMNKFKEYAEKENL